MSRPLRIEFPGALYHVTSRGNARQAIFRDTRDRARFCELLGEVVARWRWRCHAYCLMGNHYHLVLETPEAGLSAGMRQLNGVYSQEFNRRHRRVGHVLQGRFHAVLVDREAYLLELCRYVVLNPVRAGLVASPEDWPWSSHRAALGLDPPPSWLCVEWLLAQWSRTPATARRRYAQFVAEGHDASPWTDLRGGLLLGSDAFVQGLEAFLATRRGDPEIPKPSRTATRPPLRHILRGRDVSPGSVRRAHVDFGYTLAEIARQLGVHRSTVSRRVSRSREAAAAGRELAIAAVIPKTRPGSRRSPAARVHAARPDPAMRQSKT